jgi:hypothetical protein
VVNRKTILLHARTGAYPAEIEQIFRCIVPSGIGENFNVFNTTSTGSNEFMTHQLKSRDIIALGFMTFALFVGAGNIIFPPMVGLQAGEHVWTAAFGFLITAVGLPVLTVVALAKVGGGVDSLSTPIGKVAAFCWRRSAIWPLARCLRPAYRDRLL